VGTVRIIRGAAKIAASDLERRLRKTIRGDMGGETVSDSGVKLSLVIFVVSGAALTWLRLTMAILSSAEKVRWWSMALGEWF
jgi:hypothetical protein